MGNFASFPGPIYIRIHTWLYVQIMIGLNSTLIFTYTYILYISVWVYNICISSKKISRGGGRFLSRDQRIEAGGVGNGQVNSATSLYS